MKYAPELYAYAFIDILSKAVPSNVKALPEDVLCRRFLEVIRKNGDMLGIDKILKYVERALIKKDGGQFIKLEFARPIKNELQAELSAGFDEKDTVEVAYNPTLISGVRITVGDEIELDNSLNRKLKLLFG